MKLFFLIFSIFCFQSCKAGFGSIIGSFFNDCIDEASSNLIGKVKQALIESMDVLFDKKITPMIHEIEATSNRVMDHTKDDVNAVVDNFKTQIQSLVDDAVKNADAFVDHSVEEIKENILQNAFDNLNNFEDKLQQDLNSLLNKVDAIIFEISCSSESLVDKVVGEIKISLPSIPNPFESCRNELSKIYGGSIKFKFVSSFTDSQLYDYKKCQLIGGLTETTPIHAVKAAYRDLEQYAAKMRCASVAKKAFQNEIFYLKEMGKIDFILTTLEHISPI